MEEEGRKNTFYDKVKFMEGATWMCDKVVKELEKFDLQERQILEEFESRVLSSDYSKHLIENTTLWLKEALEVIRMELQEQAHSMRENSEFH